MCAPLPASLARTQACDANGATTRRGYDALNRLIRSLDPMGDKRWRRKTIPPFTDRRTFKLSPESNCPTPGNQALPTSIPGCLLSGLFHQQALTGE
jgi:YD repeat-containing protein